MFVKSYHMNEQNSVYIWWPKGRCRWCCVIVSNLYILNSLLHKTRAYFQMIVANASWCIWACVCSYNLGEKLN
jgi:hypothetical protein